MKYGITVLMIALFLSGCGKARFDDTARLALPHVVEYSRYVQSQAAEELEACPAPALFEMMKDYAVMRDQARRARGERVRKK